MTANRFAQLLFTILFFGSGISVILAQDIPPLNPGGSYSAEIKGGQTQTYSVALVAGQTAAVEVEQSGVDVSLTASASDGRRVQESESPSGLLGLDSILVIAEQDGTYIVGVTPADPRAVAGKYVIRLTAIRPTSPTDREINGAATKITALANETVGLRREATRESRRRAVAKFNEIIELSRVKRDPIWEIVALLSAGVIHEQLGEVQASLDVYRRGLELARTAGNLQYEGSALNNLAVQYNSLGEFDRAIGYLTDALALQRKTGNRRAEAIVLNNLGMSNLLLARYSVARTFFEQSLVIRREVRDERGEATTLNNLGNTLARQNDLSGGLKFLTEALELRRRIGERQGEAISLRNIGGVFRTLGEDEKSESFFRDSRKLAAELGDRRLEAETLYSIALCRQKAGDENTAIEHVRRAIEIGETIRGEILSLETRSAYFSTIQDYYDLLLDLLVARYERTGDQSDIETSFQVSERARARGLLDLLAESRVELRRGVDPRLATREDELQELINGRFRQRTQLLAARASTSEVAKIESELKLYSDELDALRVRIRRESPAYAELKSGSLLSLSDARNLLDSGTSLLEYKLGEKRSFLWFVNRDRADLFVLPGKAALEKSAVKYFETVSKRGASAGGSAVAVGELSVILPEAVRSALKGRRAVIVPDGVLQYIPFASLPDGTGRPLVEQTELVFLPSVSALGELRRSSPTNSSMAATKQIGVFADAVFDRSDARLKRLLAAAPTPGAGTGVRSSLTGEPDSLDFQRLLASRFEARSIAELAPQRTVLNLDFAASREKITTADLSKFGIIHFATHGVLDAGKPQYSGLVLSMFDERGRAIDGFLRLEQIFNLNIDSDLVVLSACRTALGRDVRGEGMVGLTRAFFFAGTKRVIASLWRVDDVATADLMKFFYRNLLTKKMSPPEALRAAQNEMKALPRYRDPYFWAGFVIQGEWRPAEIAF